MNKWKIQKLRRRAAISEAFLEEVERVFDSYHRERFIKVTGFDNEGIHVEYEQYQCGSWETGYETIPYEKFTTQGVSP